MSSTKHINKDDGWRSVKMGELFDFKNGVNADKSQYGSGTRFVNVMEVINHDALTEEMIPGRIMLDSKTLNKNTVEYGDILFNRTSETPDEIGLTTVYIGKEKVVFGGFVIRARAKTEDLTIPFRKYCFGAKPIRSEIIKRGQGAVRSNIGQEDLRDIPIELPPIDEQRRIVAVLETWDQAIEKLKRKIEIQKGLMTGLMQKLPTGKIRSPGFSDSWKILQAGELFKNISKKNYPAEPLLSATQDQGVVPRDALTGRVMSPEGSRESYKLVEPGNFVISLRSFQGGIELSRYRGIVSPAYTVLTENMAINHEFYRWYFKTHKAISDLNSSVIGIRDGKQISYESFKDIEMPYPTIKEQEKIVSILSVFESQIALLEKRLLHLNEQKTYLLNNLITGTIRTPENMVINP